ncbi:MAG: D-serine ammonia-lyase [Lentisphaerae bacterium GWF2_44_16]|nr:MAG: D-serine ammonia-lyase [Lentisphaerae bacterium GWF2_44_16]
MEYAGELELLKSKTPFLWINNSLKNAEKALSSLKLTLEDMRDAQARLYRFAPLIMELFKETSTAGGIIESELRETPHLKNYLSKDLDIKEDFGRVFIKEDHNLPVAGSIKARGGIYEVLCFAEQLAIKNKLLDYKDNYIRLASPEIRKLFGKYTVSVGSTGNLGLSIGVMSAALGFSAKVHMSAEAKEWKKERLRKRGVTVVEHASDYTAAVEAGRKETEGDPFSFFVDDENSIQLFLGYSVAAFKLKSQLENCGIKVDNEHPLFVHLPCGVGGAPGGITFGLKQVFGDAVHCFFAEPVESPCMTLGLASGKHSEISVYDIGLTNRTDADGLAVSRPSRFVGETVSELLSGSFTVEDKTLYRYLYSLYELEKLKIEPSAAAGFPGPAFVMNTESGMNYLKTHGIEKKMSSAVHILWTTGGSFVPDSEYDRFFEKGRKIATS